MKMIENLPMIDKFNAVYGAVVAILTYFLGEHWVLFAAFLALNIGDYITGNLKAVITGKTNSKKGAIGIAKKLGYWFEILLGFGMAGIFMEIGECINVDLQFTTLIGWFVLATLIINEIRSILENLVEAGYKVPAVLVKGLEVANNAFNKYEDKEKENI